MRISQEWIAILATFIYGMRGYRSITMPRKKSMRGRPAGYNLPPSREKIEIRKLQVAEDALQCMERGFRTESPTQYQATQIKEARLYIEALFTDVEATEPTSVAAALDAYTKSRNKTLESRAKLIEPIAAELR